MKYIVYSDGGSRGNPGPAGYGFIVYDENSGEPTPVAGREMTKKFRLMFDVPDAELQSFTASLEEAGFAPVFSEPVKYKDSPDEGITEMEF